VWLRRFALEAVLAPAYLAAGLCKIRYDGLADQFKGEWISHYLAAKRHESLAPSLNRRIAAAPALCALFSLGNLTVEVALPLASILAARSRLAPRLRRAAAVAWVGFHVSIFGLLGPNFIRFAMLAIFAADPTADSKPNGDAKPADARTHGDFARALAATALLSAWFAVQLRSDVARLTKSFPLNQRMEPSAAASIHPRRGGAVG